MNIQRKQSTFLSTLIRGSLSVMPELEPVGYQLVIVTLVFCTVALVTLSIRIGFRVRNKKYDVSDTCLIAAMVS